MSSPTTPVTPLVSTSAAPVPTERTDTLYLLDAPHMAATLLPRSEDIRTPIIDVSLNVDNKAPAEWKLPMTNLLDLQATLRAYVDVNGVITWSTGGSICFWAVYTAIEHADGSRDGLTNYCFAEQALVANGIRLLEFSLPQKLDVAPLAGDRLVISIQAFAFYAPGASIDLLSGTLDHDSSLTITGLQLPIDTQTYL